MKKYIKQLKEEKKGCTPRGCIVWASVDPTYMTAEEYKEQALKINERTELDRTVFFARNYWLKVLHSFQSFGDEGRCELRVIDSDENGVFVERYLYLKDKSVEEKIENEQSGFDAFSHVNGRFKELTGMGLKVAFSGEKELYKAIKKSVPKQISYFNEKFEGKFLKNVFKADVSSAFSSQIVGKPIPTLQDAKVEKGVVEPSEEFPFAFYKNSHHLKIYGENVDTRTHNCVYYEKFYSQIYDDEVEEEETILLKRAPEELEKALWTVFQELYDKRHDGEQFKFFMNAGIGFMHKNSNPILSHIAAVTIARINDRMLKLCYNLKERGQVVLLIATDSEAWQGTAADDLATNEKFLGSFTYEHKNCEFYGTGPKRYQIKDGDKLVTKCAGLKKEEQLKRDFGFIPTEKEKPSFIYYEMEETSRGIEYPEPLDEETSKIIESLGGTK